MSRYEPLIQDPTSVDLKQTSRVGEKLLRRFHKGLNAGLGKSKRGPIWYQPDNSNWPMRYYWMYHQESDKHDFITRLNYQSNHAFQIQFSHFGARSPKEVDFIPDEIIPHLLYKGFPAHVLIDSENACDLFTPLIAEHFVRIYDHFDRGGTLPLRGASHLEIAVGAYLKKNDHADWDRWHRPDFLTPREVDLASIREKIAIEVQGSYFHNRKEQKKRDEVKRADLIENGWSLIWAWESAIKEKMQLVVDAVQKLRDGECFVELKK